MNVFNITTNQQSLFDDVVEKAFLEYVERTSVAAVAVATATAAAAAATNVSAINNNIILSNNYNFTVFGSYYDTNDNSSSGSGSSSSSGSSNSHDDPLDDEDMANICNHIYNPESDLTKLEFWVCGVILNVVGILGIFGNILSMVILSRPQMRSSINYLLIGLARCDTVLIITSMLLFGIPSIYPYTGYLHYYYNYIYPNISPCVFPIAMAAQTASVYMTFTVTLERYVAVCHPLKARALCTYGRAKIYFIICIVFAILYNLPRFWEVVVFSYNSGNEIMYCIRASKLRQDPDYINIYIHWCYLVVIYFIPFLNLAILNCLIYKQIKRANHERQRLSRTERREIGLATMLLCVVVVFFLLNFLALYTNILEAFYGIIDDYLTKISNLLVTINSSVNFLIYVIFGEKFKRIFLLIFFNRRLSRDQPDLIHYESSISNGCGIEGGGGTNRSSVRFSRHNTQRSITRNDTTTSSLKTNFGNSIRLTNTTNAAGPQEMVLKIKRSRAPSPGPCVYYPARDVQRTTIITSSVSLDSNWNNKNGQTTTGF